MTTKRLFAAAMLLLFILGACTPPMAQQIISAVARPAAAGVGACHWMSTGLHDDVGWGYDATKPFHWGTIEASMGVFDCALLDDFMDSHPNMSVWLSIQTVGRNLDGDPKAPGWLLDKGAVWHTGTCTNG